MASGGSKGNKGKGKGKKEDGGNEGTICAHIGCDQPGELKCAQCRAVFYCSEEHQRLHWKKGGHKRYCTPAPTAAAAATPPTPTTYLGVPFGGTGASGSGRPPPVPDAAAAPTGPRKVCGACQVPKPVAAFSNSQLKKKAKRRCQECFDAGRPVAEARGDPVNP